MSRALCFAVVAVLLAAAGWRMDVSAEPKMTLKEIMKTAHKGEEAPVQTVLAGKADEKMLKEFLGYYEFMAAQKPPAGDEASWKQKTVALVDATKGLIDKKPNALEAMKTAINCKACHSVHKPKK